MNTFFQVNRCLSRGFNLEMDRNENIVSNCVVQASEKFLDIELPIAFIPSGFGNAISRLRYPDKIEKNRFKFNSTQKCHKEDNWKVVDSVSKAIAWQVPFVVNFTWNHFRE